MWLWIFTSFEDLHNSSEQYSLMQISSCINLSLKNEKGGLEVSLGKESSFPISPILYQKDPSWNPPILPSSFRGLQ